MKRRSDADFSPQETRSGEASWQAKVSPSHHLSQVDPQLLQALAGLDPQASMAVVQRTRRSVMAAAQQMRAAQLKRRRQAGLVLLVTVALVILLTPAIWSVVDDLFAGEHFFDAPTLTMSLIATLISTIFAALIIQWRHRQSRNGEKF